MIIAPRSPFTGSVRAMAAPPRRRALNEPNRLKRMTRSKDAMSPGSPFFSTTRVRLPMPAQCTSARNGPAASAAATAEPSASASVTSAATNSPPRAGGPPLPFDAGGRGAQRGGVGGVGGDELAAEVGGDLLALRRREVGDDHPPARGGDRLRGGQPEAGRAAGDEGRDALEIHDRVPPVVDEVLPRTINSR